MIDLDVGGIKRLVRHGAADLDQDAAAAPVYNVLHLVPVEVHRGVLALLQHQQLFCFGLGYRSDTFTLPLRGMICVKPVFKEPPVP